MSRKKETKKLSTEREIRFQDADEAFHRFLKEEPYPYPEKLYVVSDPFRSDVFCLHEFGESHVTVSREEIEGSVNYIREDVLAKYAEGPLKESLVRAEEDILIWQDKVESLKAARVAVIMTYTIRLKKLFKEIFGWIVAAVLVLFLVTYCIHEYIGYSIGIIGWILLWSLLIVYIEKLFTDEIKHWDSKLKTNKSE